MSFWIPLQLDIGNIRATDANDVVLAPLSREQIEKPEIKLNEVRRAQAKKWFASKMGCENRGKNVQENRKEKNQTTEQSRKKEVSFHFFDC